MGRGGFHGLATGHLDDVSFINIQPVIKAARIEGSEEGVEKGRNRGKIGRKIEEEDYIGGGKKTKTYIRVVRLNAFFVLVGNSIRYTAVIAVSV